MTDMIYKIADAAKYLGVTSSTVKKYYLLVEKSGYTFKRTKQGHIIFSDQDLQMFTKIMELRDQPGISVQDAVTKVVEVMTGITTQNNSSYEDSYNNHDSYNEHNDYNYPANNEKPEDLEALHEKIDNLTELVEKQNETVNKQQEQIKELLDNQPQKMLTSSDDLDSTSRQAIMNELNGLKKMMRENKRNPWWKFW